ncbi:hypothetical protein L208DRAFT_1234360 [Tricholoma matsutake]|nr:hypothetical protein L208DRAFT_1234360 [Tricholoma matsutake 945]
MQDEDAKISYVATPNVSGINEDSVSFYPWYANSGTTSHLTNEQSAFIDYAPIKPILIYGLGKSYASSNQFIYRKHFTPDHPNNLSSIGRIDTSGGKFIFGNHKVILYNNKTTR